jgi:transposase
MIRLSKLAKNQIRELNDTINDGQSSGREVRRAQTVLLVNQEVNPEIITGLTGYSRRQSFHLRKLFLEKGISALRDKRKGQPKELLTKKQRDEIVAILKNKTPRHYGYDLNFWSTSILGEIIKKQYKAQYKSKTSYYLIFRQAKFSYHKPGRIYEKRNEQEVKEWREKTKPVVEKALNDPDTVILVEDEMSLSTQTTIQKIWLPQGEYPKIEVSSKRESRSIYGFLNIKTKQQHAFKTKWQNMYITSNVLRKLRKIYPTEKLLLIWDQAPWHRGSKAQEFIREDKNIQTIYFPRAAPEENPQEHVWKDGRSKTTHNKFIQNIDNATDEFVDYLNRTKFHYSFLSISAIS